eukprot:3508315-Amphidinium_carterae.1
MYAFRCGFAAVVRSLGLKFLALKPYGLRRGGATELFRTARSMDLVVVRGRWGSQKVARIYVNEGLMDLATVTLPPPTRHLLDRWWREFVHRCLNTYGRTLQLDRSSFLKNNH